MNRYRPILLLAFTAGKLAAADYYLAKNGSDTNPGTSQAKAWQTIARANVQKLVPGDRLLFEGGQVFPGTLEVGAEDAGAADKPVTVGSWGSGRAILDAGNGDGILAENAGHIDILQLEVRGAGAKFNRGSGIVFRNSLPDGIRLEGVRISNVSVHGFWYAGILIEAQPPDKTPSGYRNVEISDSETYDNVYFGIYVSGENTGRQGYAHQNVRVQGCKVHDNPGDPAFKRNHSGNGILLDDVDTGIIEHCLAYGNGAANGSESGGPVGIWAHSANRVVIQFCESYSNRTGGRADGGGFDLDGGVTNSIMQYNYSYDNDGAGYLVWNYDDAPHELRGNTVRFNVSKNDGRKHEYGGIHIGTSDKPVRDLLVYNNTVLMQPANKAKPSGIWIGGKPNEGIRILNNVVVTTGPVPLVQVENQQNVEFRANAFWSTTKTPSFAGIDATKVRAGGIDKDPQLDQRLCPSTGSPLIDAGVDLSKLGVDSGSRDICGRKVPSGSGFDIGACEFVPGDATCVPKSPSY